ncbi:MAG TPA: CDP-alcohol phosphatidyltransferase family protein [Solirubrobacteraceae bacterium]|nr:CDP-alcohol phosphatidyltransferase family protein [Solirubrobacteraceae bacterium]
MTLARATLAIGVAALVADAYEQRTVLTSLVAITASALALDAVDGWVARRTGTTATFGALFDGEVDAFLMLVLSVYLAPAYGAWVLTIGAARYAFLAAGWALPWMRAPLPARWWRKVVTATQGVVLTVVAAGILPLVVSGVLLVLALALLAESFGRDVWWLWARPAAAHQEVPPDADLNADLNVAAGAGVGRSRLRTSIGAGLTVLALLLVWAALVAPDRPQSLTLMAFLRVPLDGLVLVGLAAFLPAVPRRLLAAVLGPTLALVVILKVLDIAFYTSFERPFDIIGDAGDAGIGIETLRSAIGNTQTNLLIGGGIALAAFLFVFITLAIHRLMRVAAANRRGSLSAVSALSAVWLLCSALGAQFLSHTPIASSGSAGFLAHEVGAVEADLHDETVFANQIRHDPSGDTPGSRLLTALRGKDVLLVFVESYGKVSVQGSSFSPAINALLDKGTRQLRTAGFSARTAFVDAPGFGGMSWLAHSTLQSGVWANSQRRYDQLVATNRFTLSDAFSRARWRTINFGPADDRTWPEGSSFYHYDKLYDRRDIGYHGPTYNYAPMPDQFMFAALQRLELAKTHRRPLFAEVDTVSSHMPWDSIPQMISWNDVGNGSIFKRTPTFKEPSSFWWQPRRVKAAYARSLEYSLNTLISFVQHYGKKNLVLMVVGDEQPLPIVSGQGASHDVPISLIAHDPSVLKRIKGWGWGAGLRPSPHARVWPMSAVRDRFLTAFGPRGVTRGHQ